MVTINLLKAGDEVLAINEHFLAIKRKKGAVDIYNLFWGEEGICVDPLKAATIGFGNGTVEKTLDDNTETKIVMF